MVTEKLTKEQMEQLCNDIISGFESGSGILFGIPPGYRDGICGVIKATARQLGKW